jgi:hypothetical protein
MTDGMGPAEWAAIRVGLRVLGLRLETGQWAGLTDSIVRAT